MTTTDKKQHYEPGAKYTEDVYKKKIESTKGSSKEPQTQEERPTKMETTTKRRTRTAATFSKEAFVVKHFEQHSKYTDAMCKRRVGSPEVGMGKAKTEEVQNTQRHKIPEFTKKEHFEHHTKYTDDTFMKKGGGSPKSSNTEPKTEKELTKQWLQITPRPASTEAYACERQLIASLRSIPQFEKRREKLSEVVMMLRQQAHQLINIGLSLAGNMLLCKRLEAAFGHTE